MVTSACFQVGILPASSTNSARARQGKTGRFTCRFSTISCCHKSNLSADQPRPLRAVNHSVGHPAHRPLSLAFALCPLYPAICPARWTVGLSTADLGTEQTRKSTQLCWYFSPRKQRRFCWQLTSRPDRGANEHLPGPVRGFYCVPNVMATGKAAADSNPPGRLGAGAGVTGRGVRGSRLRSPVCLISSRGYNLRR